MKPEEVTAEVTKSGLRGKGGGGAALDQNGNLCHQLMKDQDI